MRIGFAIAVTDETCLCSEVGGLSKRAAIQCFGRQARAYRLAHAEVNALINVEHATVNIKDCALYTTLEPCALCVGAIRMLALKDVRYAASDRAAGSLPRLEASEFMRRGRVQVQHLEQPDLEAVLIAMNTEVLLSISQRFEL
jgi:tRNA(Arg) A34 adenosine deaminase TadA